MDLTEDIILKLAALGWNGKEDPLGFLICGCSHIKLAWRYANGYVDVFWRNGKGSELVSKKVDKKTSKKNQKRVALEIILGLFYTINGNVVGPNSDNLKNLPEWT